MAIESGQHLHHYRLIEKLGEGGMGVVWQAEDQKLGRQVAIKILPETFAGDPERLARFEREAKLLASLNHGNIATVHGFDQAEGVHFLVLELVEGETLARRLEQGALSVEEALGFARQIAEALEAAHASGVIHRDLKTGNVMIRPDRTVKVLDFGLAKGTIDDSLGSDEHSPTMTADFTSPGVVLGTAAYMSPEQARGRPVDKRSDIFSFGVILFECLTGDRLFQGESAHDSMGAILHKEPDWSLLPQETPPTIKLLLRRCLTKARKRRLHDIADARVEIEEAISDPTSSSLGLAVAAVTEKESAAKPRRFGWPGLLVGILVGAAIAGTVWKSMEEPPELRAVRRFQIAGDMKPRNPVISPDGTMVAFESENVVYVRDLNALETRKLWAPQEGTEVRELAWSPDSRSLGVIVPQKVMRISISSGQALEVADAQMVFAAVWSDDGNIFLSNFKDSSIVRVFDRGGAVETVLDKGEGEVHFHTLDALPDGRGLLFMPHPTDADTTELQLLTPGGDRKTLYRFEDEVNAVQYSSTGHLVYHRVKPKGIWALSFSLEELEARGDPFLVVPDRTGFSLSDSGDLVYSSRTRRDRVPHELAWVDRSGKKLQQVGPILSFANDPRLSHDGRRVAVSAQGIQGEENPDDTGNDIWIVELDRGIATRLAAEEDRQGTPAWSPDDRRIAYQTFHSMEHLTVYARAADGSGEQEVLFEDAIGFSMNDDWSMAAVTTGMFTEDLWIVTERPGDPSSRRDFQNGDQYDSEPRLRPGGGLIAYSSGDILNDQSQIFLRRFPEGEGRWPISSRKGYGHRWNRAGDRLYYFEEELPTTTLMEVPVVVDGERIEVGEAKRLFSLEKTRFRGYDVGPDGQRFLMVQTLPDSDEESGEEGIVIVENWVEEFRGVGD